MKNHASILLFIVSTLLFAGCKPDPITDILDQGDLSEQVKEPKTRDPMTWQVDAQGRLVFEDEDHLWQGVGILTSKSPETTLSFEDSLGFRSLRTIEHLIRNAEEENMELFYQNVPDSMPIAYYDSIPYTPSSLYQHYLDLGIIVEEVDSFGGISFRLAIDDPGLVAILNESQEVIVGNEPWTYRLQGTSIGLFPLSDPTGKTSGITANFNRIYNILPRQGEYATNLNGKYWIIDPCKETNKEPCDRRYRYFGRVVFTCSYSKTSLIPNFYMEVGAEMRKGKTWNRTQDYLPFWGIYAKWCYRNYFRTSPNSQILMFDCDKPIPVASGNATSIYSVSNLNRNSYYQPMHPSGYYAISSGSPWEFADNLQILDHYFEFKFSGCGNGRHYFAN